MSLSETQLLGMSTSGRLCVISPVLTPEQSIGESSWSTEWCRGAVLPTYTGHEDHGWQRMGLGWEGKEGRRNSLRSVLLQPSAPEAVALSCGSEADSCMWARVDLSGVWVPWAVPESPIRLSFSRPPWDSS